jgi:CRP/FNR family transcriptional regulator, cyclic AMP receptor protein
MPSTIDVLRSIDFFSGFNETAVDDIASGAERRTYHRNDVIFTETDPAESLYIVVSGRVAISNRSIDGRESVLALMGPSDLFGDMALFDGQGRSAGARALETSEVIGIGYDALRRYFENDAKALWNVVGLLVGRLREANEAIADSVFLDVTGRTAKRLLDIAGEADEFTLPITQEELAGMIGASRERVNKAIAAFVRLGWLEQRDRAYKIVDRRKLTNRAS